MSPKASCGVLYPPLRGIVQLTNSVALRFRNWSFSNKTGDKRFYARMLHIADTLYDHYLHDLGERK